MKEKLRKLIQDFKPFNEQEAKDKEVFLKYIDEFDDVLTRNNEFGHFTSSAFIVNPARTKILMVHHNILDSWAWPGGHVDGESDFLSVALRETREETSVENPQPVSNDIFVIDTLPVPGHFKKGKYVPAHTHLDVGYLLEVDEGETLHDQADENTGVKWFLMSEVIDAIDSAADKVLIRKCIDKLRLPKEEK